MVLFGFLGERLVKTYDSYLQSQQPPLVLSKVRVRADRNR
jgi:hypothetical protein